MTENAFKDCNNNKKKVHNSFVTFYFFFYLSVNHVGGGWRGGVFFLTEILPFLFSRFIIFYTYLSLTLKVYHFSNALPLFYCLSTSLPLSSLPPPPPQIFFVFLRLSFLFHLNMSSD